MVGLRYLGNENGAVTFAGIIRQPSSIITGAIARAGNNGIPSHDVVVTKTHGDPGAVGGGDFAIQFEDQLLPIGAIRESIGAINVGGAIIWFKKALFRCSTILDVESGVRGEDLKSVSDNEKLSNGHTKPAL